MSPESASGAGRPVTARSWLILRLRALRAFSFPLSVLPVPVAAVAAGPWRDVDIPVLIVSAAGALLLHSLGNLLNDWFDFRAGVDRKVAGDEGRPGRFLVRGELTPRDILLEALAAFVLGVPLAVYLVWRCGPVLFVFGGAAAVLLYAYTGWPFRLKYRALGEAVIFLVFGPLLMTGAAFAQTGRFAWPALWLSLPVGLAVTAVLTGNNIRDLEEDSAGGIATLAHRLGPRRARWVYAGMVVLPPVAAAGLALGRLVPTGAVLGLASLAPGLTLLLPLRSKPIMRNVDALTARWTTVFLLLLLLGLSTWR